MMKPLVTKQLLIVPIAFLGATIGFMLQIPLGILVGSFLFIALSQVGGAGFKPFSRQVKQWIQMLIGGLVGLNLNHDMLDHFISLLFPGLLVSVAHILFACMVGILLNKLFQVDWLTAICGTIPAGMSEIAMVAEDAGADVQTVMLMHLFRVSFIITILPLLVSYLM
ncbi:AbrB family transcriptional regulator [Bacillus horti]|nr:AbrB family transcriptional regulator [Bacillus horti]